MANRIFINDINKHHPYKSTDDVDQYYTQLANKIVNVLDNAFLENFANADERKEIAVAMALYLEDVVSGTMIWQTFTTECKARYGNYLPFYPITKDYYVDEVNYEDVRFLLWHKLQVIRNRVSAVLNPENPGIAGIATQIIEILDDAYETAPENERMLQWMEDLRFAADNFIDCRETLSWFHYNCYLFCDNLYAYQEQKEKIEDKLDEMDKVEDSMLYIFDQLLYGFYAQNTMGNSGVNLLGFCTPWWAEKILATHTDVTLLKNIKVRAIEPYVLDKVNETTFWLKSCTDDAEEFPVSREPMNIDKLIATKTKYVQCQLVWYGGTWWVNGYIERLDEDDFEKAAQHVRYVDIRDKSAADANKMFLKASGGERLVFCKDEEEVRSFFTKKIGIKFGEDVELPPMKGKRCIIIFCVEHGGFGFLTENSNAVYSPKNPSYDKAYAEKHALSLAINMDAAPYSLARLLWEGGYLPDAGLNSMDGFEHGKKLFADNADFFIDYFHHSNKESLEKKSVKRQ